MISGWQENDYFLKQKIFYIIIYVKMAELSKKAQQILDAVKELTIVELNELVTAMEEEFGVSAAAPVVVAGAAAGGDAAEEKTSFDVILTSAWAGKIAVIKVIREVTGLGLKEGKDLADNWWEVKKWVSKAEADEVKAKLEEAGASVEIK